jgi:hypothetical protein
MHKCQYIIDLNVLSIHLLYRLKLVAMAMGLENSEGQDLG